MHRKHYYVAKNLECGGSTPLSQTATCRGFMARANFSPYQSGGKSFQLVLDTSLARSSSREAVVACSPRRKPGVTGIVDTEPRTWRQIFGFLSPHSWLSVLLYLIPQAYAQCRQNKGIYMMARMSRSIDLRRVNICSHIDEEQSN
jgi:hypothetical protein